MNGLALWGLLWSVFFGVDRVPGRICFWHFLLLCVLFIFSSHVCVSLTSCCLSKIVNTHSLFLVHQLETLLHSNYYCSDDWFILSSHAFQTKKKKRWRTSKTILKFSFAAFSRTVVVCSWMNKNAKRNKELRKNYLTYFIMSNVYWLQATNGIRSKSIKYIDQNSIRMNGAYFVCDTYSYNIIINKFYFHFIKTQYSHALR